MAFRGRSWLPTSGAVVAPSSQTIVALGAFLVALTLVRVLGLAVSGTDLFVDEAQYWAWSRELAPGYYSKPPLIAWIIAGASHVCGDGEFCVRLPSPLIHAATSVLVFLIGRRLYSAEVGLWSALAFATLPGISLSSGIISTDVPLLFAWALALFAFADLITSPRLAGAIVLGLALGLGLNAKYAMAYLVPCAAIFFLLAPESRRLLRHPHLWIALAIGLALIAPNIAWNAANGFATLAHTADSARWSGDLLHPGKAAEFFLAQFGVVGPILFGALLVLAWRARLSSLPLADRLLLAFSVPIIVAITIQALLSHAFANWAAPAYVAAVVLVTAAMTRERARGWLKASLAINGAIALVLPIALWQAGRFEIPGAGDPFARTLGNREIARSVAAAVDAERTAGRPVGSVVTSDREITAALLYYAPELTGRLYQWRDGARARDHFELSRPFTARTPGPALLVTRQARATGITGHFASAVPLGAREARAGQHTTKRVHLFVVSAFRGG